MAARVSLVTMALVLAVTGCVSDEQKLTTVPSSPFGQPTRTQAASFKQAPQATQQVATRVSQLGQKVIAANPRLGQQHVAFLTLGVPDAEIFHRVRGDNGEIYITEGLVRQCKSDGELAAMLCQELGKMASEQAARTRPARAALADRPPLLTPQVGNDIGGRFGPADGTDQMLLARADKDRREAQKAPPPPPPESLARTYMQSAGFDPKDLDTVTPLLRKADQNNTLEKLMTGR